MIKKNYPPSIADHCAAGAAMSFQVAASSSGGVLAEVAGDMIGPASGMAIGAVLYTPSAALTSSHTANTVITVAKRTAGGAATTIATVVTDTLVNAGTGDWTKWSPVTIPVSAGAFISASDVITITMAASIGIGQTVPAGFLSIFPATQ